MSANDIRELETLDRIPAEEGGDLYLVNGNMIPIIGTLHQNKEKEETTDEEILDLEESVERSRRH